MQDPADESRADESPNAKPDAEPEADPDAEASTEERDADTGDAGDVEVSRPSIADDDGPLRYEIVFDCRDRILGSRLLTRLEEVAGPTWPIRREEEGPTWSVIIEFPDRTGVDRFFSSDFYRQFCVDVRRSCRSSVLVVPLGAGEADE